MIIVMGDLYVADCYFGLMLMPAYAGLLSVVLVSSNRQRPLDVYVWLRAFVVSLVLTGVCVFLLTELLSALHALSPTVVTVAWALADLMLLIALALRIRRQGIRIIKLPRVAYLTRIELAVLGLMLLLACVMLLVGIMSPPNTWDAMTYHLARVVHWMQSGSVAFYPTHIDRQLTLGPFAEQILLHLYLLSGVDRWSHLVQFAAMLGSVAGVVLIAREIGAGRLGQILTAVACFSLPMGVLQATSTQNDYVVSFCLVAFALFVIKNCSKPSLINSVIAGAALGLGVLTKSTAYLFGAPFAVWLVLSMFRRPAMRRLLLFSLIPAVALIINLPHYARNISVYSSPLGATSVEKFGYLNESHSPQVMISNISRNLALHVRTPIGLLNNVVRSGLSGLHGAIRIDINDPGTTWTGAKFDTAGLSFHEDTQGNGLQLLLLCAAVAVLAFRARGEKFRAWGTYLVAVLCGGVLFATILKWQPWHSRLHLPLFVLSTPLVGLGLASLNKGRRMLFVLISALLLTACGVTLYVGRVDPLITKYRSEMPRENAYFDRRSRITDAYVEACNYIASQINVQRVGLLLRNDDAEYPLYPMLRSRGMTPVFGHVNVKNASASLQSSDELPDLIFSMKQSSLPLISIGEAVYTNAWNHKKVSVYLPAQSLSDE